MKRIYIFPRYSGNESSDWYQQAISDLYASDEEISCTVLNLPNWDKPDPAEFLSFIKTRMSVDDLNENSYFIGHSVGCQAALLFLDFLAKAHTGFKIGGFLCIAGWWTVDKPWEQLKFWIDQPNDFDKIKEVCNNNISCLLSDNDPFTSDTFSNQKEWEEKLNAKVTVIPNAKHFNTDGYVEVIAEINHMTNK